MARPTFPRVSRGHFLPESFCLRENFAPGLTGLACGWAAMAVCQGWIANFGTGIVPTLCAIWAATLGLALGGGSLTGLTRLAPPWAWTLCLLGSLVMLPAALSLAAVPLSLVSVEALSSQWVHAFCLFPGALLVWGTGGFQVQLAVTFTGRSSSTGLLAGALCGAILGFEWIAPVWGSAACLWSGVIAFTVVAFLQTTPHRTTAGIESATSSAAQDAGAPEVSTDWSLRAGMVMFCGVLPAVLALMRQWFVPNVGLVYLPMIAFGAGCLTACWRGSRRFSRIPSGTALVVALLLAGSTIACEHFWIALSFRSNLTWSSLWTIESARACLIGIIPFCFGMVCGRELFGERREGRDFSNRRLICFAASAWSASLVALSMGLAPKIPIAVGIVCAGVAFAAGGIFPEKVTSSRRLSRLASAAALVALAVTGIVSNAELSHRVPYRPLAIQFALQGAEWDEIIAVDDARRVRAVQTDAGLLTLWNHYGLQTLVRRDGLQVGAISHDYRVMPHSPVDIALASIPFAMHASPTRVCFLGWGSGVPVSTALEFPVEYVVCVEADAALPHLTWPTGAVPLERGINPLDDERFRLYTAAPRDAVRARLGEFDVMISNSSISSLPGVSAEFTADYYRDAARHLSAAGIFCQRFQHADLGARSADDVLATMRAVFPAVFVVNVLPGESLLIGTLAQEFETGEELTERFQAAHQTRVLARCGWDWGHFQKLPTLTVAAVDELVAENRGAVSRATDDRVAFAHARDLSRWGAKWEEKQTRLAARQVRFADLAGESGQTEEVRRRIEETNSQQYVMDSVPDRPWAYRATLKKGLQTKPRSKLVQVKGERPRQEMHPVDRRRLDYLKALSAAYGSNPPEIEAVHRVTAFFFPYDPLVSYFTHHEAAELYSRIPELDRRAEYLHRLHTIYFGDARDRSIRNVVAAITLLNRDETGESDPQVRFDQLNGLLQILYQRWQTRRGQSPDSVNVALNDITASVNASEESLRTLERLAPDAGTAPELWEARRQFLEAHLIRPLRSYRGQIMPHQDKRPDSGDSETDLDEASELHDEDAEGAGVQKATYVAP